MMRLENKIALITGGARGLGRQIALDFLKEGAIVFIVDIDQDAILLAISELAVNGSQIYGSSLDVTKLSQVTEKVETIAAEFGRIDILVNNAGITQDAQLLKMTEAQFDAVIAVNLKGVFNCARAVAPIMVHQGSGRIINTASVVAHNGNFGQTNYAAAKAGVIAMTKTWAKELGKKGINVNAVAPGYTLTEMVRSVPENILAGIAEKVPLRRLANPDEISGAFVFLASNEATYVNGAVINVDGGLVI
jgi:3-oxoacyl-[acyl-carrier protein] reductase